MIIGFKENPEEIRVRAYYLWEAAGRPHGRCLYFWKEARKKCFREYIATKNYCVPKYEHPVKGETVTVDKPLEPKLVTVTFEKKEIVWEKMEIELPTRIHLPYPMIQERIEY